MNLSLDILLEVLKIKFAALRCLVNSHVCKEEKYKIDEIKQNTVGPKFLKISSFFCPLVSHRVTWSVNL